MPNEVNNQLTRALTQRTQAGLNAADTDGDGKVSATERQNLPADVRPLADGTADKYFGGGALPTNTYVEAYDAYVSKAVALVDKTATEPFPEAEQRSFQVRFIPRWSRVEECRESGHQRLISMACINSMVSPVGTMSDSTTSFKDPSTRRSERIWQRNQQAVLTPKLSANAHTGDRFFEAVAWYTDRTVARSGDSVYLE